MVTPTKRITTALAAGRRRMTGPSSEMRLKARLARTATRPIDVIVAARPRLKATISARPKPIRCRAIALSRTTSAEGHGRRPAATPTPSRPRRSCVMVVVAVLVAVAVVVIVSAAPRAREEDRAADDDHEQARGQRQPGIERLGDDEAREQQGDEAEREDADRVRDRHDAAEQDGVDGPALRSDEVPGDDRLAVSGRERVRRAPEGRDQQREEDHAQREVAARDE